MEAPVVLCERSDVCDESSSRKSTGDRASGGEDKKDEGAAAPAEEHRPLSPPPPPPLPDPNSPATTTTPTTMEGEASQRKTGDDSSSSHNNNNNNNIGNGDPQQQPQLQPPPEDESVAVLIPHNFGGLPSYSAISSLNSSFRSTYNNDAQHHHDDANHDAMDDPDDILNLELVEDDDDDTTCISHASVMVEVRDPLHIPVALRELWLSPQQQQQQQEQQQIPSNKPQYPTSSRASGTPSYSTSLLKNAYHEREDKVPVWPSRGRSICSEDSERIKEALNKQCFSQHNMMSSKGSNIGSNNNSNHSKSKNTTNNNNNPNNSADQLQHSNNSSFPSMWEDSWSTFATLDNSNQAEVILEEGVYFPPTSSSSSGTAPTAHGVTPKRMNGGGGGPNIANQNSSSIFQQMSHQQRNLLGGAASAASSNNNKSKRSSMMTNTAPPRRTNSRNSQYSSYSDNMSRSTMDASQIKRVSRNERISRLKRKSRQPPQQGSVGSLSPTQNFRKHHPRGNYAAPVESSYASSSAAASSKHSLSQNSQKPQRRPTKVLPRDEEADAEPDTFFQHSESQLSLTSSEEEDEEYAHESDTTPRLPGRRSSVTSTILYEEEQAVVRRSTAQDEPLSQPLRRNSTWGSTATSTINLEAHPETVEEEDDEESYGDIEEDEESVVRLVMSEDNRYHVPVATHQLMEDNSSSDNLPVSSIHLQYLQDDSDQNLTTSTMNNREMQDDSDNNFPSSIHMPPTRGKSKNGHQHPDTIKYGDNPAPAGRTRSIPRAVVARNQREWLMTASSATAEDLQHVRRSRGLPDFIPNKPKRQSTLTKEDLYARLLGNVNAGLDKDNDNSESETKEKSSVNSSSLSMSSPSNASGGHKRLAVMKRGHRRSLSGEAPHPPMRQVSRTSTVMSPALVALDSLSFHDSKEFLMLSNKDQDILQESLSSHAGDFDFGPSPPSRSLQSVENSSHSKTFHATRHHGSRGDLTETSLSVELHPVPPHGELQNSTVSAATTHRASNIAPPGRVLPVRHNTRGSSLRSAAASLQLRGSASSPHSDDDAHVKADEEVEATETLSPSTEFEELKKLNECTVQSLNEQLDNLQVGVAVGAAVDKLATTLDLINNPMAENAQLQVSELSSSTRRREDLGAASEQDISFDALGCSNHSSASVWTSASKEFEHLKVMMDDDNATDLETQLKLLEQLEADQNNDSAQDFDLSRLLNDLDESP